ncbi:hypothetical protein OHA99_09320 [Streptomyces coelicoflavus]|uniref:hypothetical protein n=1 Tax=Streptomyces coelicoflavus TaxID=285562 RepID=UPI0032445B8A
MTQQNPNLPEDRVAELHRLAAADYASTAHLRALRPTWPAHSTAAAPQADRPTVRHANGLEFRVIDAGSYTARMARDVHQVTMADGRVWTVGQPIGWYGTPAAWQPRCPAATASDTSPCPGPVVVLVLGLTETGIAGCEHHAARRISTAPGTYPVALPHAPAGTAARVFRAAGEVAWR